MPLPETKTAAIQFGSVARAAETFLQERLSFVAGEVVSAPALTDELLRLLGCYSWATLRAPEVPRVAPGNEEDARTYLPRLLTAAGDPFEQATLLDGLCRHGRWRDCIETISGAYELADAIFGYLAFSWISRPLVIHTKHSVLSMLNEWLKPSTPWTDLPGDFDVCRQMFSPVWCDLALPDQTASPTHLLENSGSAACYIVSRERPPFLPGLYEFHAGILDLTLPSLEAPE
jgi:hypothetical protein